MADKTQEHEDGNKAAKGPGLMTLVKAVAFVSVIVLIEVAAASMLIPSVEETEELAEQLATSDAELEMEESGEVVSEVDKETGSLSDMLEVELGTFHVLTYDPETGTRMNVDFELFGIVLADEESDFYTLYDANQRRIREQILITVRSADVTDLTDAGLGLIKRKILEKTNRALGRPLLHEAVFSKFSFEER